MIGENTQKQEDCRGAKMRKKDYETMLLSIICFEEADVITLSENDYDNTGDWVGGWEDILGKLQ